MAYDRRRAALVDVFFGRRLTNDSMLPPGGQTAAAQQTDQLGPRTKAPLARGKIVIAGLQLGTVGAC